MTDKLSLYNKCLFHLEERSLASLTENREPRRVLDALWASEFAYCLSQGLWTFMKRTVEQDASSTIVPLFGYNFAFNLPPDWVRTITASASPTLSPPFMGDEMALEGQYIYTNFTPIYHAYVSNDALYGANLGAWPEPFADYVSLRLARVSCKRITGSDSLLKGGDGLIEQERKARLDARGKDAMNLPPMVAPLGTWNRSRRGGLNRMPGQGDEPGGSLMT